MEEYRKYYLFKEQKNFLNSRFINEIKNEGIKYLLGGGWSDINEETIFTDFNYSKYFRNFLKALLSGKDICYEYKADLNDVNTLYAIKFLNNMIKEKQEEKIN